MSILASYKTWSIGAAVITLLAVTAAAQQPPPTPGRAINVYFAGINKNILDMAQDFPADKYGFRLKPEMRSFGEVIVHVASGNAYAAKKGRGETANWDEIDAKDYKTKEAVVGLLQKTINDATATLKGIPEENFGKTLNPWFAVIEHSAEHYGLLVAYYRANGLVPPQSRPQPKK